MEAKQTVLLRAIKSGAQTEIVYGLSAYAKTANADTPPTDVTAWQELPPSPTAQKPFIWQKLRKNDGLGTTTAWKYVRLTGEPGQDGKPGQDGEPGQDGKPGEPGKDAPPTAPNILLGTPFQSERQKLNWNFPGIIYCTFTDYAYLGLNALHYYHEYANIPGTGTASIETDLARYEQIDLRPYCQNDQWLTLSFYAKGIAASLAVFVYREDQISPYKPGVNRYINGVEAGEPTANGYYDTGLLSMTWKRYSISFKLDSNKADNIWICFRKPKPFEVIPGKLPERETVSLLGIKLEVSDVPAASAYMPHTADLQGEPGEQGIEGAVYRRSEWQEGKRYVNELNVLTKEPPRYIDVVCITTTNPPRWFVAKEAHNGNTSNTGNRPLQGAQWNTYWEELSDMEPVYTPLIIADNAVLRLAQSNQILLTDDNANVNAGVSGGNISFWSGATLPDSAPTRVYADGTIRCEKLNAVTGSEMGGWTVDGNTLKSSDGNCVLNSAKGYMCFNGFILRQPTVITPLSEQQFVSLTERGTKVFSIAKLGTLIIFNYPPTHNATIPDIIFPTGVSTDKNQQNFLTALQFVGTSVIIVNNGAKEVLINGTWLKAGQAMSCTCTISRAGSTLAGFISVGWTKEVFSGSSILDIDNFKPANPDYIFASDTISPIG